MEKKNISSSEAAANWIDQFDMLLHSRQRDDQEQVSQYRKEAIDSFKENGFPSTRHEEWKYTSVKPLLSQGFRPSFFRKETGLSPEDLEPYLIEGLTANVLVFVNGFYEPSLSKVIDAPENILVQSLEDAQKKNSALLANHYSRIADFRTDGFTALNTAFFLDGTFVHVPKGKVVEHPVQILHLMQTSEGSLAANTRNLFLVEENAQVRFFESRYTLGDQESLCNQVSEVEVGKHAHVEWYVLQEDQAGGNQINHTQVNQAKQSVFKSYVFSMGGGLTRNTLNITLQDEHCEAYMYGLYLLSGKQHVDNHTLVDHAMPNCYSNELYKGVMMDQSTGVFNGKIMVRKDAQKTNAFQSNRNLLLSEEASINTKPQLEIFADDVKCSHGATTGMSDKEALFYVRSRGMTQKAASALLTEAFANEVLENANLEPLTDYLRDKISDLIQSNLS